LEEVFAVSDELAACYEFKETFRDLFNQRLDFEIVRDYYQFRKNDVTIVDLKEIVPDFSQEIEITK
jgi:hypothetical protein